MQVVSSTPRPPNGSASRRLALLVASLFVFELMAGTLYNFIVPPWQAPDEPVHFEYAWLMAAKQRPVGWADRDLALQKQIVQSMINNDFWHWHWLPRSEQTPTRFRDVWGKEYTVLGRFSLSYWFAVPFLKLTSDSSIDDQLHAARMVSTIFGALVVVVAFLTARVLFPADDFMAAGTTIFVASVPMYSYIAGMFNVDMLLALTGALLALCIALIFRRGLSWKLALASLVAVAAGLLTKRAAVFMIFMLLATPVAYFWRQGSRSARWIIPPVFLLFAVTVALLELAAARPRILPGLEDMLFAYLYQTLRVAAPPWDERFLSWQFAQQLWRAAEITSQSFWARFGWMVLPVDGFWYEALKAFHIIAGLGLLILVVRGLRHRSNLAGWQWKALLVYAIGCLALLTLTVFEIAYLLVPGTSSQGRYFFPLIVEFGLFFTLGWREILPRPWRGLGLAAIGGFLLFLNAACLFWYSVGWFRWVL